MIYVLEIHGPQEAQAWFAFDGQDLLRKVQAQDPLQPWEVFDEISARELMDLVRDGPLDEAARQVFPAIAALGDQHGWDTTLFRADHLLGAGMYQPDPIKVEQACLAALDQRTGIRRVYWTDQQAIAAIEGQEPLFEALGGWRARHALREQLLSLEVLAEDV